MMMMMMISEGATAPRLKMRVQTADSHVLVTCLARCTVFFCLQVLLKCHDVLGSTPMQVSLTTVPVNVWCSNGGQQRYILPSVIRLVSPQAGEAKNEQNQIPTEM